MEEKQEIRNIGGIFRRRRKSFLITFGIIFLIGVIVAFALPPIYRSQSTILVEEQQIPQDYVKTTVTSYVEERLQMITQQIMSRAKLLEIINQFGLYKDMRDRYTTEEIIEKMRDDINLETISADVVDRRTGRPTAATIAFTLSYEGKDPVTVQKVANVLASLYLEENLKAREQRASTTTAFFQQELNELKKQIDTLEAKISDFKRKHIGELPEHKEMNMQALSRLSRDLDQVNMQVRSLQERKIYLEGQLATVDPLKPMVTENGKTVMNPKERLKYLRLELISMRSRLSDKHPDVIKLKKEIKKLESEVKTTDESIEKIKRLEDLKGQLAKLRGKLGPKHPDVIALQKEVDVLSKEVAKLDTKKTAISIAEEKPDNPAYINLKTQIASTEAELKSLLQEKKRLKGQIEDLQKKIANAPLVEKEYNDLTRDYENAKLKYNELMSKFMEAKVAQGMEESQRGERFTIIDPAQLPEKPYKPNRFAIILISFVLALGAGVGVAAARESLDFSVKSVDELNQALDVPVLSVISFTESPSERRARRLRKILWLLILLAAIAGILAVIHFYIMPLDILWIKLQRRISLGLGV